MFFLMEGGRQLGGDLEVGQREGEGHTPSGALPSRDGGGAWVASQPPRQASKTRTRIAHIPLFPARFFPRPQNARPQIRKVRRSGFWTFVVNRRIGLLRVDRTQL